MKVLSWSVFPWVGAAATGLFFFVGLTAVDATSTISFALGTAAGACFLVRKGRGIAAIVEGMVGIVRSRAFFFLCYETRGGCVVVSVGVVGGASGDDGSSEESLAQLGGK